MGGSLGAPSKVSRKRQTASQRVVFEGACFLLPMLNFVSGFTLSHKIFFSPDKSSLTEPVLVLPSPLALLLLPTHPSVARLGALLLLPRIHRRVCGAHRCCINKYTLNLISPYFVSHAQN